MKPCPFCGSQMNPDDPDTLYPSGIGWVEDEWWSRHYVNAHNVPKEQWCYKIVCQEHYGGCGAEIHGDSVEAVKTKWNTRT